VLLKLPQDITAKAVVLFTRFWIGAEGGSLKEYGAKVILAPFKLCFACPQWLSLCVRPLTPLTTILTGHLGRLPLSCRQAFSLSEDASAAVEYLCLPGLAAVDVC
jgi:hypothetical protein